MEYIDKIVEILTGLGNKYFPLYFSWLSEKLSGTEPFTTVSFTGFFAVFFLALYLWYRMRN